MKVRKFKTRLNEARGILDTIAPCIQKDRTNNSVTVFVHIYGESEFEKTLIRLREDGYKVVVQEIDGNAKVTSRWDRTDVYNYPVTIFRGSSG